MTKRTSGASSVLISSLLVVSALAACGRSTDDSSAPPAAVAEQAPPSSATTAKGSPAGSRSASLTWPQGTDAFALNVCTSIGEHTIQGGGNSDGGKWNLVLDGNLLKPGDTGRLTVSQKSDMSVVYDARLTDLTVAPDGSFTGSGEDASSARFTITGTCDVTW